MMADERKVIERKADGEFGLTSYGEFLSYFHTHIQLFGNLISQKKIPAKDQDALKTKIRSYIVTHVQKTDHFFDQLPQFAQFLGISTQELSSFMNRNFLNSLNKVKAKMIEQELAQEKTPKKKRYSKITDEILDGLGFIFPAGHKFEQEEAYLYLVNTATGKKIEAAAVTELIKEEEKAQKEGKPKPVAAPVRRGPETPITQEILAKYNSLFSGKPLVLKKEELEPDNDIPVNEEVSESELSDVEDLNFTGDFSFQEDSEPSDPPVSIPFSKYMDHVNKVRAYQKAGQVDEYKRWLSMLPAEESVLVQLQTALLKETKGEVVDWEGTISQISNRTGLSTHRVRKVLDLGRDFLRIRTVLESSWNKARAANPGIAELVRKAWPHILKVMDEYPDFSSLRNKMEQLFSRIPDANHRKILSDLFLNPILSVRVSS
ncbi:hypothetical protein CH373_14600 [Leptospira perolatii]|uniref:Uncharacterized protein n=1 Tax=Leptospira perolatii TaxID=2023191 RepID=A0A2M9ZJZ8_9LEPT|nr:hypothetical protein [Leptospira perolatii]PJZ69240.1 hypothetical protein CH360_12020 [Leptospira perolatii]PJZ72378.1 hypothetical protein CH373_14600 [Leptospira perolatii]